MTVRGACAALAVLLAGCGEPAPGTVVGDAFLAQNVDQHVELAAMPVHLLRPVEELDSTLTRLCPPRRPDGGPPPAEAWARGWEERRRILRPLAVRTAVTDARARFTLDTVPPGTYLVWADTALGEKRWTWLHPVTVRPGDTLRVDLTNANPDENPLRCADFR